MTTDQNLPALQALGRGPMPARRALECFEVEDTITSIELRSDELICRCPVTQQTDIYRITIRYRPNRQALETKSLKLYLGTYQFETGGLFAEHLADRIAADLDEALHPLGLTVTLVQNVRGGIVTTVTATRGQPVAD